MMSCMSSYRWQKSRIQTQMDTNRRSDRREERKTWGEVKKIFSRRTWGWSMNNRSNLREVVRAFYFPFPCFLIFFLLALLPRALKVTDRIIIITRCIHADLCQSVWASVSVLCGWEKVDCGGIEDQTQRLIASVSAVSPTAPLYSPSALLLIFLIYLYLPPFIYAPSAAQDSKYSFCICRCSLRDTDTYI